jgi:hypothetical protein
MAREQELLLEPRLNRERDDGSHRHHDGERVAGDACEAGRREQHAA